MGTLAKVMVGNEKLFCELVSQHPIPRKSIKQDGSPVTELDIALSDLVEQITLKELPSDFTFYSEENFDAWTFPLLALDPLDGTREYLAGRPEWAMSIGLFQTSKFEGEGWVFNPLTKESFTLNTVKSFVDKSTLNGEVSRSEWESGLFKNIKSEKVSISPMGSIAYKLGRLSAGKIDFVVSLRPKNIWDIAGGTLLCQQAGLKFYSQGKIVTEVKQLYEAPLIWCHESSSLELLRLFS